MIYEEQPENPAFEAALKAAAAYYQQMEAQIDGQDYLLGNNSFADIAFFMAQVFGERKGALLTGATPQLLAWLQRADPFRSF